MEILVSFLAGAFLFGGKSECHNDNHYRRFSPPPPLPPLTNTSSSSTALELPPDYTMAPGSTLWAFWNPSIKDSTAEEMIQAVNALGNFPSAQSDHVAREAIAIISNYSIKKSPNVVRLMYFAKAMRK